MLIHRLFLIVTLMLLIASCRVNRSLRPADKPQTSPVTLSAGDLTVTFIDNTKSGDHRAGYNGIAGLRHRNDSASLFVPAYAGFNLEHIFGGDSLANIFEPRQHPMELFRRKDSSVVLYQAPTPLSGVETSTEFRLVAPHYIDVTVRCRFTDVSFFSHGYAGLFWASYIHAPRDKRIYFPAASGWVSAYSPAHGVSSTHRHISDTSDLYFAPNFNVALPSHFSDHRFTEPFYYGRFGNLYFAYLFRPEDFIRFSQSPTGGGDDNPAWDFYWVIPKPQTGKIYSFQTRLVYCTFESAQEVRQEYERWRR